MDLVGAAEVVSAAAVLVGFGFAVSEVRRHRGRKARESALALVSSYQTPDVANAITLLIELPEGLTRASLKECCQDDGRLVSLIMATWESTRTGVPAEGVNP
ncbi:hypothetical protein ACFL0I_00230 [Gemmatimonadota bacterium]